MSRKWVEKEAPLWIERGIVTREQVNQILNLYEDKKHAVGLLPILGSILLGLGILSFIAANWQDIPQLLRLGLVIAAMAGFYGAGETMVRRGSDKLGIALVALGVISFGGGIILIGQMFHLMAYHAGTFILWSAAGTAATYLYRSRYLYLLSLLLVNVAQWYSANEFDTFSYTAFGLLVLALGAYVWKRRSNLLIWLFSFSVTLHLLMWTTSNEIPFLWMFVPAMALYVAGDWLEERHGGYALQAAPLAAAFVFGVFMVLFPDEWRGGMMEELRPEPLYYIGALVLLFAVSLAGKMKNGRASSAFECILFVPFLYIPSGIEVLYLLSLFFFSLYVLWRGYTEEWRFKINFGTMLFICSTLVAYGKLTWDFMDKSLFFMIGGIILLGLSWFLNRRKKQVLDVTKEGNPHE
ncbi:MULTISPECIES: DUF2157 domain-containing protein [unclassified Paenibacillus]|uniref:DUF2157 domain-containing protein n=1 Tax=unclassified Paenibacillus TaxID=185978 RepID=UPI001AEB31A1|nr:putative membrane protein [Paenibacillus sp. PvP091]MBP1168106.1 putative membrane protein [Paenibacillus sp. PvR098]MBP2439134.1 putative membrane protein [Paenibacillus sp. PvP052]